MQGALESTTEHVKTAETSLTDKEREALAETFLAELGKGLPDYQRVMTAYPSDLNDRKGFWSKPNSSSNPIRHDRNAYAMISSAIRTPRPKTGEMRYCRDRRNFGSGLALMVDDIGNGKGSKGDMSLADITRILPPTVVVETSPQNFQCWYFLDAPVEDRDRFEAFIQCFAKEALPAGGDHTIRDITRLGRFPIGINNKRLGDGSLKYGDAKGEPFQVRQVSADYSLRYSMDAIAEAFEFEIVIQPKRAPDPDCAADGTNAYLLKRALEFCTKLNLGESGGEMRMNGSGKYRMICPWKDGHSSGDGSGAVLWGPEAGMDNPYLFSCSHDSCKKAGRGWTYFTDNLVMPMIESDLEAANDYWQVNDPTWEMTSSEVQWKVERFVTGAMKAAGADAAKFSGAVMAASGRAAKAAEADEKGARDSDADEGEAEAEDTSSEAENDREGAADGATQRAKSRAELETQAAQDLGVGRNWYHGWWYSMGESRVCRPGNKFSYSTADFNATFGGHFFSMKSEEKFNTKSAFAFVQNVQKFKIAAGTAYVCGKPSVFEWKGSVYVNTFNAKSIPATATEYTDEGLAAIETIRYHIRNLTGDETAATYIESWIAMNVKKPGELIGMAPLIKGIEGDGKTIIFQGLMKALMGDANIGLVSGDEVTENTGWAKGSAVVAIEELKTDSGNNRHHVTNRMKQYITNDTVDVVDKYIKRHETMNATNYVAMTNFSNALPLNNKDRRWMVIFTQWKDISQLIAKVGAYDAYFAKIGQAIATQAAQLRKFFMEYELAAEFHWNMRAPETEGKLKMIGIEAADSGINKIKAYLSEGELGVCEEILCTRYLQEHIERDTGEKRRMTRQIATMLEDLDYTLVPRDIKWNCKSHTVYVKDPRYFAAELLDGEKFAAEKLTDGRLTEKLINERLRKMLDETKTPENLSNYVPSSKAVGF